MPPSAKSFQDLPNTVPRADPLVGATVGEYRIERRLGAGGMGVVYAGLQPIIQKPVAIKVLQPEAWGGGAGEADRLIAEARAANAVRHRGIVDVFAFGNLPDGRPYIVMDLLEGEPLDELIGRDAPLALDRVLGILDETLDTLGAAHAAGVVHRDLKPANLFLVRQASGPAYVRILDFGLAKRFDRALAATAGRASTFSGTPHYMAPEQATGGEIGPAADLFAVGVMAFEMLTGKLPFDTENALEQISRRVNEDAPRVSSRARVPPELDELVGRLLQRDPARRPASAAAARSHVTRLRRVLHDQATHVVRQAFVDAPEEQTAKADPERGPATVRVAAPPATAPRPSRRRLALGVAGGLALLVLVFAAGARFSASDRQPSFVEPPELPRVPAPAARIAPPLPDPPPAPPETPAPKVEAPPAIPDEPPPKAEAARAPRPKPKPPVEVVPAADPKVIEAKPGPAAVLGQRLEVRRAFVLGVIGSLELRAAKVGDRSVPRLLAGIRQRVKEARTVEELKEQEAELRELHQVLPPLR